MHHGCRAGGQMLPLRTGSPARLRWLSRATMAEAHVESMLTHYGSWLGVSCPQAHGWIPRIRAASPSRRSRRGAGGFVPLTTYVRAGIARISTASSGRSPDEKARRKPENCSSRSPAAAATASTFRALGLRLPPPLQSRMRSRPAARSSTTCCLPPCRRPCSS